MRLTQISSIISLKLLVLSLFFSCCTNSGSCRGKHDGRVPHDNRKRRRFRLIPRHNAQLHKSNASCEHKLRRLRIYEPNTRSEHDVMFDWFRKQFYLLLSAPGARRTGGDRPRLESLANLFIYTEIFKLLLDLKRFMTLILILVACFLNGNKIGETFRDTFSCDFPMRSQRR